MKLRYLFLGLFTLIAPLFAWSQTWYVSLLGDGSDGLSPETAYCTLTDLIEDNVVGASDTIVLCEGGGDTNEYVQGEIFESYSECNLNLSQIVCSENATLGLASAGIAVQNLANFKGGIGLWWNTVMTVGDGLGECSANIKSLDIQSGKFKIVPGSAFHVKNLEWGIGEISNGIIAENVNWIVNGGTNVLYVNPGNGPLTITGDFNIYGPQKICGRVCLEEGTDASELAGKYLIKWANPPNIVSYAEDETEYKLVDMLELDESLAAYGLTEVEDGLIFGEPKTEEGGPLADGGPYKETVNGIEWMFSIEYGEAIIGVTGSYNTPAISKTTAGAIKIPSVLGGCPVAGIGEYAFYGCSSLLQVEMPSSLSFIEEGAFYACDSLEKFVVDEDNVYFTAIDGALYTKDLSVLILCPRGRECLEIPEGVGYVSYDAFVSCHKLKRVSIPSTMWDLGVQGFLGCSSLEEIVVAEDNEWYCSVDGVLYSKDMTYLYSCPATKTSVELPCTINGIDYGAFDNCSSLEKFIVDEESVYFTAVDGVLYSKDLSELRLCPRGRECLEIPEGVGYISYDAFDGCHKLKRVSIPSTMWDLGWLCFYSCSSLEEIIVAEGNECFRVIDGMLYSKDRTCLWVCPRTKTSVVIPNRVTMMAVYAFSGCSSLEQIEIPWSLTNIPDFAFSGCPLASIKLPSSLSSIGQQAFVGCRLESIYLSANVCMIGEGAFESCALRTVYVDEGDAERIKELMRDTGVDVDVLEFVELDAPLEDGGPYTETVDEIEWTFSIVGGEAIIGVTGSYNTPAIPKITAGAIKIPSVLGGRPVVGIGEYAFYECTQLTSIEIPDTMCGNIESWSFYGCTSLTSIRIPEGVNWISNYAFYGCSSLTQVELPSTLSIIYDWAFDNCDSLAKFIVDEESVYFTAVDGVLYSKDLSELRLCPRGRECLEIPEGVGYASYDAFVSCHKLKRVSIPSTMWDLGVQGFLGCSSLEEIAVERDNEWFCSVDGVLYSKDETYFYVCPATRRSVKISSEVIWISQYAFVDCNSLTMVFVDDGDGDRVKELMRVAGVNVEGIAFEEPERPDCLTITKVKATDKHNGSVDIAVTFFGTEEEVGATECVFAATNTVAGIAIPVKNIVWNGDDEGSGTRWTRHYLWDVAQDVRVSIEDIAFAVNIAVINTDLPGVQLWDGGPYWAECNVGAETPEDYGYYFWWGDTVGYVRKEGVPYGWYYIDVTWEASSGVIASVSPFYYDRCPTYMKSISQLRALGYLDVEGNLDLSKDAAAAHLGAPWRMPKHSDVEDLCNNCTFEWIGEEVKGLKITGQGDFSDKSIFLPAAGTASGSESGGEGFFCNYATSSPHESYFDYAWNIFVNGSYVTPDSYEPRFHGLTVRPVREAVYTAGQGLSTRFSVEIPRLSDGGPYTETVNGIEWTFSVENGEATIGASGYYNPAVPNTTAGAITIPSMLGGCPVVGIGKYAFYECTQLTSVEIPETVRGCIENRAFNGCTSLTSIRLPEGIEWISNYAFYGCSSLTQVELPSTLTSIIDFAFDNCDSLENFIVAEGSRDFATEAGILYTKDKHTLRLCPRGRTSLVIPEGVASAAYDAFYMCEKLTRVFIPSTVYDLGELRFRGCTSLEEIAVSEDNEWLCSVDGVLYSKDKAMLIACPGARTSLVVLDGVTSIASKALEWTLLVSVELPESLTTIPDNTFMGCYSLTSVKLPSKLTAIGMQAFWDCSALESIYIPSSVDEIGENAFAYCQSLTTVYVDEGDGARVKELMRSDAYLDIDSVSFIAQQSEVVNGVEWSYYTDGSSATLFANAVSKEAKGDIEIPAELGGYPLATIEQDAFAGCDQIVAVTIPASVTTIEDGAFSGCTGIMLLTLNNFTTEPLSAECGKLDRWHTEGNYNGSQVYVSDDSVDDSESAELEFTIPEGLSSITFSWKVDSERNYDWLEWYLDGELQGRISGSMEWEAVSVPLVSGSHTLKFVYVKDGSVSNGADCGYVSIHGITSCAIGAIFPDSPIEEVVLGEGSLSIPPESFAGLINLTTITIPGSVLYIGEDAFANCEALTTICVDGDDAERVKRLMRGKGVDVDNLEFVEDYSDMARLEVVGLTCDSPSPLMPGDEFSVTATIHNRGGFAAEAPWSVDLYLTDGPNEVIVGSFTSEEDLLPDANCDIVITGTLSDLIPLEGNVSFKLLKATTEPMELGKEIYLTAASDSVKEDYISGVRYTLRRSGFVAESTEYTIETDGKVVSAPLSVTMPANNRATTFNVTPIDDQIVTGDRVTQIVVSGDGCRASHSLTVLEDEVPSLTITLSASTVREGEEALIGTVTRDYVTDEPLVVYLSGASTSQLKYPSSVTIPAGEASVDFEILAIDNTTAEINTDVTLRASATGYNSASHTIRVEDDDIPGVKLELYPEEVSEGAGVNGVRAKLLRTDEVNLEDEIIVNLKATPSNQLILPAQVKISARAPYVEFTIGVVDDDAVTDNREVTITGSIYVKDCGCSAQPSQGDVIEAKLRIIEDDVPSLKLICNPMTMREGLENAGTLTISHNSTLTEDLVVTLQYDVEGEIELPETVTIPAGVKSISVPVKTLDDGETDGGKLVSIYASDASGVFASGSTWVMVSDYNLPDLMVSYVEPVVFEAVAGETIQAVFAVTNIGFSASTKAIPYFVHLVRGSNAISSSNLALKGTLNKKLEIDTSERVVVKVTMPEDPGDYRIAVVLDSEGTISETDSLNNTTYSSAISVSAAYTVTSSVNVSAVLPGTSVTITGHADLPSGAVAKEVAVEVYVILGNLRRTIDAVTDANGDFSVVFTPTAKESGHYTVGASYPGLSSTVEQASFDILGFERTSSAALTGDIALGETVRKSVYFRNRSNTALTDLTVSYDDPSGCWSIETTMPGTLPGNETIELVFTALATGLSPQEDYDVITFTITTAEGVSESFKFYTHAKAVESQLRVSPGSIDTTMAIDVERYIDLEVVNDGKGDSGEITLELPKANWLSFATPRTISNLKPGESATITLLAYPTAADHLVLNNPLRGGNLLLTPANGAAVSVPLKFTPVSTATGTVKIDAVDNNTYVLESAPHLEGATIKITNPYTGALVASGVSAADGVWMSEELAAGKYQLVITAPNHDSYADEIIIEAGRQTSLTAFLQYQVITTKWEVTRTEIEDEYEIELKLEYETRVPAPVVETTMPEELPILNKGESYAFYIHLENLGLIAAEKVSIVMPSIKNHTFTLAENDVYIPAKSTRSIACVFRRNGSSNGGGGSAGGDVDGNDKPVDDVDSNDKPVDDVDGNDKPVDDVDGNDKPSDDVDGNDKPDGGDYDDDSVECVHLVLIGVRYWCGDWYPEYGYEKEIRHGQCKTGEISIPQGNGGGSGSNVNNSTDPHRGGGGSGGIGGGYLVSGGGTTVIRKNCDSRMNNFQDAAEVIEDGRKSISDAAKDAAGNVLFGVAWSAVPFSSCINLVVNSLSSEVDNAVFQSYSKRDNLWAASLAVGFDILGCGLDIISLGTAGTAGRMATQLGKHINKGFTNLFKGNKYLTNQAMLKSLKASKHLMHKMGIDALAKFRLSKWHKDLVSNAETILEKTQLGVTFASGLVDIYYNSKHLYNTVNRIKTGSGRMKLAALPQQNEPIGLLAPEYEEAHQLLIEDLTVATLGYAAQGAYLDEIFDRNDYFDEELDSVDFLQFVSACLQSIQKNGKIVRSDVSATITPSMSDRAVDDYIASFNSGLAKWNNSESDQGYAEFSDTDVNIFNLIRAVEVMNRTNDYAVRRGYKNVSELWEATTEAIEKIASENSDSVCASVTLQLSQTLAMTREAFDGTLTIHNGNASTAITDVKLEPSILNPDGDECKDLFAISVGGVEIENVEGSKLVTGEDVAPGEDGVTKVRFIPSRNAAPTEEVLYRFGGTLTYTDPFTGENATVKLVPVALTVSPSPYLELDYFVQRDVYGDDPFTDIVEASMPAELAVLVRNTGAGDAKNVRIASVQPEIALNEKGAAIEFSLRDYSDISAALNGSTANLSIKDVDLDTIKAGESSVAQWWLTSSLDGHFSGLRATVTPVNSYNTPDMSLVSDKVRTHKLIRSLSVEGEALPYFLTAEGADLYGEPTHVYSSDGEAHKLVSIGAVNAEGSLRGANVTLTIVLTAEEDGWCYVAKELSGISRYTIASIVRDGTALPVRNAWTTDKVFRDGLDPLKAEKLHLADQVTVGQHTYTIELVAKPTDNAKVMEFGTSANLIETEARDSVRVTFSKPIDPESFTTTSLKLVYEGMTDIDLSALTITPNADYTSYTIGNLAVVCGNLGHYELTVFTTGLYDLSGQLGAAEGLRHGWSLVPPDSPFIVNDEGVPVRKVNALDEVVVNFSTPIRTTTFNKILLNGEDVSDVVKIDALNDEGTRFAISGLDSLQEADGEYTLSIPCEEVVSTEGVNGSKTYKASWTRDTIAPELVDFTHNDDFAGTSLTVKFSEEIDLATLGDANISVIDHSATRGRLKMAGGRSAETIEIKDLGDGEYALFGLEELFARDGDYEIVFSAEGVCDEAGNESSGTKSIRLSVDVTPPEEASELEVSSEYGSIDTKVVTAEGVMTLSGKLPEEGLTVKIFARIGNSEEYLGEAVVEGDSFTAEFELPEVGGNGGNMTIVVQLTDAAGNASETSFAVHYDLIETFVELTEDFRLKFSAAPIAEDVLASGIALTHNGAEIEIPKATIKPTDSATEFVIEGLEEYITRYGEYVLSVDLREVRKALSGKLCGKEAVLTWRNTYVDTVPPVVAEILFDDLEPLPAYAAMFEKVTVAFSEPVNIPELIANGLSHQAIRLEILQDGNVQRTILSDQIRWDDSSLTAEWTIDPSRLPIGEARLVIDGELVKDLAGNRLQPGDLSDTVGNIHAYEGERLLRSNLTAYACPALCDWDGDGVLDMLVGEIVGSVGKVRVYVNQGTSEIPVFSSWTYLSVNDEEITFPASGCQGVQVAVDTRKEEMAFGLSDGSVYVWKYNNVDPDTSLNEVPELLFTREEAGEYGAQRATIGFGDINNDRRSEFIVGGGDGRFRIVRRGKEIDFDWVKDEHGEAIRLPAASIYRSSPAFADYNGDKILDILSGDAYGNVWAFLGNGDGSFASTAIQVLESSSGRSRLSVGDLDADNVDDLVIGYTDGSVYWYRGIENLSQAKTFRKCRIQDIEEAASLDFYWEGLEACKAEQIGDDANIAITPKGEEVVLSAYCRGEGTLSFDWSSTGYDSSSTAVFLIDKVQVKETIGTFKLNTLEAELFGSDYHHLEWRVSGGNTIRIDNLVFEPDEPSSQFTEETEKPIAYSDIRRFANTVWKSCHGDYEAAVKQTAANGMSVYDCCIAGLDASDPDAQFVATITIEDGLPVVSPSPDLGSQREYLFYGSDDLEVWAPIGLDEVPNFRFFKVTVELK